jgi:site-specific recombinase XerD
MHLRQMRGEGAQFGDTLLRLIDSCGHQRPQPRPHVGAFAVLPHHEQVADLLQRQAEQFCGADEFQPTHRPLVIDPISAVGACRRQQSGLLIEPQRGGRHTGAPRQLGNPIGRHSADDKPSTRLEGQASAWLALVVQEHAGGDRAIAQRVDAAERGLRGGITPGNGEAGEYPMSPIAATLQAFFTDRLTKQRQVSPRTIASYRDSLKLLVGFAQNRTGKAPSRLDWADLDADLVAAFLDHLEHNRHNSPRTRNLRLTAIRSLFGFAALRHPEHAEVIQRVLAIPTKRFDKQLITFLTAAEINALIDAPDASRWEGRRDRALLLLATQTGLRVSELTGLNCGNITFGDGASVRCLGKGRKRRAVPLTTTTQAVLRAWLTERGDRDDQPLFPTRTGRRLSTDAVERLVRLHAVTAA